MGLGPGNSEPMAGYSDTLATGNPTDGASADVGGGGGSSKKSRFSFSRLAKSVATTFSYRKPKDARKEVQLDAARAQVSNLAAYGADGDVASMKTKGKGGKGKGKGHSNMGPPSPARPPRLTAWATRSADNTPQRPARRGNVEEVPETGLDLLMSVMGIYNNEDEGVGIQPPSLGDDSNDQNASLSQEVKSLSKLSSKSRGIAPPAAAYSVPTLTPQKEPIKTQPMLTPSSTWTNTIFYDSDADIFNDDGPSLSSAIADARVSKNHPTPATVAQHLRFQPHTLGETPNTTATAPTTTATAPGNGNGPPPTGILSPRGLGLTEKTMTVLESLALKPRMRMPISVREFPEAYHYASDPAIAQRPLEARNRTSVGRIAGPLKPKPGAAAASARAAEAAATRVHNAMVDSDGHTLPLRYEDRHNHPIWQAKSMPPRTVSMPHTISSTAAEQTASQSTLTGTGSPQRAAMLALEKKSLAAGYNRASSQPSTTTTQASLSDPLLAVVDEDLISSLGSLSQFNGLVSPPAGLMIRAEEVAENGSPPPSPSRPIRTPSPDPFHEPVGSEPSMDGPRLKQPRSNQAKRSNLRAEIGGGSASKGNLRTSGHGNKPTSKTMNKTAPNPSPVNRPSFKASKAPASTAASYNVTVKTAGTTDRELEVTTTGRMAIAAARSTPTAAPTSHQLAVPACEMTSPKKGSSRKTRLTPRQETALKVEQEKGLALEQLKQRRSYQPTMKIERQYQGSLEAQGAQRQAAADAAAAVFAASVTAADGGGLEAPSRTLNASSPLRPAKVAILEVLEGGNHLTLVGSKVHSEFMGEYCVTTTLLSKRPVYLNQRHKSVLFYHNKSWRVGMRLETNKCIIMTTSPSSTPDKVKSIWYEARGPTNAMQGHHAITFINPKEAKKKPSIEPVLVRFRGKTANRLSKPKSFEASPSPDGLHIHLVPRSPGRRHVEDSKHTPKDTSHQRASETPLQPPMEVTARFGMGDTDARRKIDFY